MWRKQKLGFSISPLPVGSGRKKRQITRKQKAPRATLAHHATNKDDDEIKTKSSSGQTFAGDSEHSTVGRAGYSGIDFLEDVKCACAPEGIQSDDDIFNGLFG
jgi:hypothetical protein